MRPWLLDGEVARVKKPGRPPLPDDERQSCIVRFRLTSDEMEILRGAARRREVTVSVYIRASVFVQMLGGTIEDFMPRRNP